MQQRLLNLVSLHFTLRSNTGLATFSSACPLVKPTLMIVFTKLLSQSSKCWQTRVPQHDNRSILHVYAVCFYLFIFSFWLSTAGWLISVLVCGAIMVMINTNLQLLPRSSADVVVWSSLTNLKCNKVQQVELLLGGHPWQKNGKCYAWYNNNNTRINADEW